MEKEDIDLILHRLLNRFIKDMGLKGKLDMYSRRPECWTHSNSDGNYWKALANQPVDNISYREYFDNALVWDYTDERYTYWAYVQLKWYYCLYCAGLGTMVMLNEYYSRVSGRTMRGTDECNKYITLLLSLCEIEQKRHLRNERFHIRRDLKYAE